MQPTSESGLSCNVQANLALTGDSSALGELIGKAIYWLSIGFGIKLACEGVAPIFQKYCDYQLESKKLDQQVQLSPAK